MSTETKTLRKRIEEVQRKVAAGEIDLRPIGEALFGKWDQDYIARTLKYARAFLASTSISTETETLQVLRQFVNDHSEQEDPDGQDLHRRASEAVELLASLASTGEGKDWRAAFAAQSRKLQAVLHIPGVKEALAGLRWPEPAPAPRDLEGGELVERFRLWRAQGWDRKYKALTVADRKMLDDLAALMEEREAKIEEMREALEPFAEFFDMCERNGYTNNTQLWLYSQVENALVSQGLAFNLEPFRRARALSGDKIMKGETQ